MRPNTHLYSMRQLLLVVLTLSCRVPITPENFTCAAEQVLDCQQRCRPTRRIGNSVCDDGRVYAWGESDFFCEAHDFDGGDCDGDTDACPEGQALDCLGNCYPEVRIGNDFCDDGTVYDWGSSDFNCETHNFDGGDCIEDTDACGEGLVLDCLGNCAPDRRLGNDFCDDGTVYDWGNADFNCEMFDFDLGDCDTTEDTDQCADGLILDCDGLCQPAHRIDNGFCDDGTVHPWGNANFACEVHGWDGGDCPDLSAGDTGLPTGDDTALP